MMLLLRISAIFKSIFVKMARLMALTQYKRLISLDRPLKMKTEQNLLIDA